MYVATLAPGLTFLHGGPDGGDLIAAAHTLGVPHPSGYPTYTLLAWLASHLPVGSIAYRVNLLSAVCAGLAAGLVCLSAQILLAHSPHRMALSAATGLTLAFSSLLWSQAVIAEVYALLTLFAALLLWLVLSWRQDGSDVRLWLAQRLTRSGYTWPDLSRQHCWICCSQSGAVGAAGGLIPAQVCFWPGYLFTSICHWRLCASHRSTGVIPRPGSASGG